MYYFKMQSIFLSYQGFCSLKIMYSNISNIINKIKISYNIRVLQTIF